MKKLLTFISLCLAVGMVLPLMTNTFLTNKSGILTHEMKGIEK